MLVFYLVLLSVSFLFYILYQGVFSFYLFAFMAVMPLILFIMTKIVSKKVSVTFAKAQESCIKGSRIPITLRCENNSRIPVPNLIIEVQYFNTIDKQTDKLKIMGLTGGDCVVSWSSSDERRVTVSGNPDGTCLVTAGRKTGKAVITATCKSGKTVTFRIKVQKKKVRTRKLRITSKKVSIAAGQSLQLEVEPYPITSVDKVKYISKNPGVAAADASGMLTARAPGRAVVTVKSGSKKIKLQVTVY